VPILARSPEEVLAECLAHGIQVAGSSIVYCAPAPPPRPEPSLELGVRSWGT
jgi:hypothetical protein